MKKLLLLLPLITLLFSCNQTISYSVEKPRSTQTAAKTSTVKKSSGMLQRDGKCYKNCIIPDRYATETVVFPIYTGNDPDAPTRVEKLIVEAPQNKWVKNNNGDITLMETPARTREIRVLADTIFHKDFRYERFETKKLAEKGGFMRETEVVCTEERTPSLFLQISAALKKYGYMAEQTTRWDMQFSQAVQQFQKDNSLPVGDLNLETLGFLGI